MARNNPDKVKKVYESLSREFLSYGEEGQSDLDDIVIVHKPDQIFMLDQGPERQARSAQLISEMRVRLAELAREHQQKVSRKIEFDDGKYGRISPELQVTGNYDGFRYILTKLVDGRWSAKVTRQARNIIENKDAPSVYDSPYLNKPFRSQRDAELAVRRAINTAMIWYSEHFIAPQEKSRKTKAISGSISRRTTAQADIKALTDKERAQAEAERKRRRDAKDKRLAEKVRRHEQGRRRPSEVQQLGPGRKRVYIPKGNPEPPPLHKDSARTVVKDLTLFEKAKAAAKKAARSAKKTASKIRQDGDDPATVQAKMSYTKYKKYNKQFGASVGANKPDFGLLLKAYDGLENSRLNFKLAGQPALAAKVSSRKSKLAASIVQALDTGYAAQLFRARYEGDDIEDAEWIENPSKPQHKALGGANMVKADKCWKKYSETGSLASLLDTYKYLEIAREESKHAKDSEGVAHAKARISLVRKEFKKKV